MVSTLVFIVTGLLIGAAFGYVLQRGRFCVNSAYREILFQDYTMLRAYLLAVAVTMIGANLIEDMGWLQQHANENGVMVANTLYRQGFAPFANIIGGFIFGTGIVLAGGCGSGILYRVGEGNLAYVLAVFGFFFGIAVTKFGFLKPVYDMLTTYQVSVGGDTVPTLYNVIGVNKWIIIAGSRYRFFTLCSRVSPFRKRKRDTRGPLPAFWSASLPWPHSGPRTILPAGHADSRSRDRSGSFFSRCSSGTIRTMRLPLIRQNPGLFWA